MSEFNIKEFQKRFDEVVQENKKLQHLKERYISHSKEILKTVESLDEIKKDLKKMAEKLNPVVLVSGRAYIKSERMIQELYDKLQNGVRVSVPLIQLTYPKLPQTTVYHIFRTLQKMPNVDVSVSGRSKTLFKRIG